MSLTRRHFLATVAAAPLFAQAAKKTNLLLILSDDLGAWMTGPYGKQEIKTPNLNELARGGVRLINHYAASPVCSTSRATLFTGRVPRQHGLIDFITDKPSVDPPQGVLAPPASFAKEVFLSEMLANAGYRCGFTGRWQMGEDDKPQRGFTYWYGLLNTSYDKPKFSFNGKLFDEDGYQPELITGRAVDFLEQQKADQPFFLVASYLNPHLPYTGHPQKYLDLYKDAKFERMNYERAAAPNASRQKEMMTDPVGNIRKVAASVTALDDQIPALMRKLRERKLWENTLVVFTSESGFLLGRHGAWSKGHATVPPNMYEESVVVPMIWSWPGRLPVQASKPDLVANYDFVPSVCDALGVNPPARNLPGRSYLPILQGKPLPKDKPWPRYVFSQLRETEMARDTRYKLVVRDMGKGPGELYDLINDPGERLNQYTNPAYLNVKERLTKALEGWRLQTAS
jgi:arylsulfatase A-like enzyme